MEIWNCFSIRSQGFKDSKTVHREQQKPHQKVKLTYSNGSITNISVNITEELGKTSIWRQLTEGNHSDLKSQPWAIKLFNERFVRFCLFSNRFLDPANKKESPQQSEKRLSIMNEEDEPVADEKRPPQFISQV